MSKKTIETVLLIEDNRGDARLLREMFNEQGSHDVELTHVECMSDAEKYLPERAVDIILLDLGLPDVQGLEAVRRPTQPRSTSLGGAVWLGRRVDGRTSLTSRRAGLSHQRPNRAARASASPALCH